MSENKRALKQNIQVYEACREVVTNERLATLEFLNQILKATQALARIETRKGRLSDERLEEEAEKVRQGGGDPTYMINMLRSMNAKVDRQFSNSEVDNLIKRNDATINGTVHGDLQYEIDQTQWWISTYTNIALQSAEEDENQKIGQLVGEAHQSTARSRINYEWQPLPQSILPVPPQQPSPSGSFFEGLGETTLSSLVSPATSPRNSGSSRRLSATFGSPVRESKRLSPMFFEDLAASPQRSEGGPIFPSLFEELGGEQWSSATPSSPASSLPISILRNESERPYQPSPAWSPLRLSTPSQYQPSPGTARRTRPPVGSPASSLPISYQLSPEAIRRTRLSYLGRDYSTPRNRSPAGSPVRSPRTTSPRSEGENNIPLGFEELNGKLVSTALAPERRSNLRKERKV
jgi:hypothetical protein